VKPGSRRSGDRGYGRRFWRFTDDGSRPPRRGRPAVAWEFATRDFRERTAIPRFYQVHLGAGDFGSADSDTRVLPFTAFCAELALP